MDAQPCETPQELIKISAPDQGGGVHRRRPSGAPIELGAKWHIFTDFLSPLVEPVSDGTLLPTSKTWFSLVNTAFLQKKLF